MLLLGDWNVAERRQIAWTERPYTVGHFGIDCLLCPSDRCFCLIECSGMSIMPEIVLRLVKGLIYSLGCSLHFRAWNSAECPLNRPVSISKPLVPNSSALPGLEQLEISFSVCRLRLDDWDDSQVPLLDLLVWSAEAVLLCCGFQLGVSHHRDEFKLWLLLPYELAGVPISVPIIGACWLLLPSWPRVNIFVECDGLVTLHSLVFGDALDCCEREHFLSQMLPYFVASLALCCT